MKYITQVKAFYEPDNNTPKSRTFIKIINAKDETDAYLQAVGIECQLMDENEEIVDTNVATLPYRDDIIIVDEEWA